MEENKNLDQFQGKPKLPTKLLNDVKQIVDHGIRDAYDKVNTVAIHTYWQIGRRIVEEEQHGNHRADYGSGLITLLADELSLEYAQGFSARDLRNYRQLYLCFNDLEIWYTRVPNLKWSHYRTVLSVTSEDARYWYIREASMQSWSVRTLARNVGSQYYHRLLQSPKKEAVVNEMLQLTAPLKEEPQGFLKDPYNVVLKCYVLIDLKTKRVTHQDVGQMDMYVRMFDDLKRTEGDNPTIGLLLCSDTSKDISQYSVLHDSKQLFAAKYLTYLPSEEVLRHEIEQQKEIFYLQHNESNHENTEQ